MKLYKRKASFLLFSLAFFSMSFISLFAKVIVAPLIVSACSASRINFFALFLSTLFSFYVRNAYAKTTSFRMWMKHF